MKFLFFPIIVLCKLIELGHLYRFQINPSLQLIGESKDRFIKFDLVAVPKRRRISVKKLFPTKWINRRTTEKSREIKLSNRYMWDDIGKFWTYKNYIDSRFETDEFERIPTESCRPPFCLPRNCNKYKCGRRNCRRDCEYSLDDCGAGQKSVMFGKRVVCMNDDAGDTCVPSCGFNGICIKSKCYCENGFHGVSCLIMNTELCKAKKSLICSHGCSNDVTDNKFKCMCGVDESKRNCIELRVCVPACQNAGVCVLGKCQCSEGFVGDSCEMEVNACSPGQMGNKTCSQVCISEGKDRFMCSCWDGYRLNMDGKMCNKKQCSETGTLQSINGYCKCKSGWQGTFCNDDVDECATKQDLCQQICHNTIGSFECRCKDGYRLLSNGNCERICTSNCSGNGDCLNGVCHCYSGWFGEECSQDIDECKYSHGCESTCVNTLGSFQCHCPPGQKLLADKKRCQPLSCEAGCLNNGVCTNNKCQCPKGFVGQRCEIVDFCEVFLPCEQVCQMVNDSINCSCNTGYALQSNGRSCERVCSCIHGQCINGVCICTAGFHGPNCREDVDECARSDHGCHQVCQNTIGSYQCSCVRGLQLMPDGRTCGQKQCPVCVRGRCIDKECVCPQGFDGEKCEHDIDECRNATVCEHFCTNTVGFYQCSCKAGFRLNKANRRTCDEIPKNICQDVSCVRGQCLNSVCVCENGFTGELCDLDINECNFGSVCAQVCVNEVGTYRCSCHPGFTLAADHRSCIAQCPNCGMGFCVDGRCTCPPGHYGDRCQYDIDECETKTHNCSQACINTIGSYSCSCADGYVLSRDGRTCAKLACTNPCVNGVCLNGICLCSSGFRGQTCDTDVDECATTGEHKCAHLCTNTYGSYMCQCHTNYTLGQDGRSCVVNVCVSCVNGICNSNGKCSCQRGFTGVNCDQDVDECKLWNNVCQHSCVNNQGSYKCTCRPGFKLAPDKHSCQSLCVLCAHGQCDPISGRCQCNSGWDGDVCDRDIDECRLRRHKCDHNCVNTNGSYECTCQPTYYLSNFDGRTCIKEDDNCPLVCKNEGRCIDKKCRCRAGFTGDSCEEDVDECLTSKAIHGCMGQCRNTYGNYECICPPGYVQLDDQKTCMIAAKDTMCNPPCQNGGVCRDMSRCYCPLGFQGVDCTEDIDECTRYSPCDLKHGTCTNTYGTYYCRCNTDYVLMYDGISCMKTVEAIIRPHLRYRGRGTKGYIPPLGDK